MIFSRYEYEYIVTYEDIVVTPRERRRAKPADVSQDTNVVLGGDLRLPVNRGLLQHHTLLQSSSFWNKYLTSQSYGSVAADQGGNLR